MAEKTKTVIKIAGREYTVRAEESEEYIYNVAVYVNKKMDEIIKTQPSLSNSMVITLTAINLGDEVLKLQDRVSDLEVKISELQSENKDAISKTRVQSSSNGYNVSRKSKK